VVTGREIEKLVKLVVFFVSCGALVRFLEL
jgi:hypothetical protein